MKTDPPGRSNRRGVPPRSGGRWFWLVVAAWLSASLGVMAQTATTNTAPTGAELVAQIQVRLVAARAELGSLSGVPSATNLPAGATLTEAEEHYFLARSLVRVYLDHLDHAARLQEAQERQREQAQRIKAWTGFAEPGPYSILFVDELRDTVQSLATSITASETTQDVLATLIQDANANLERSDEKLRLLTEELETTGDATRNTRLTWLRTLETLRNRVANARVALTETWRRKLELDLAEHRQQLAFAQRQLAIAGQHVRFSSLDLDRVLAGLTKEQQEVEKDLPGAERELEKRQRDLASARTALHRALQDTSETETNRTARAAEIRRLQALVEQRDAEAETSSQRLLLGRQLADLSFNERAMWQVRFTTFHSSDLATLREGYARLDHLTRVLRSVRPHFVQQISLASRQITEQRNRLLNQPATSDESGSAQALFETYREREELARSALRALEKLERLAARWKESLDQDRRQLPIAARVRDLFGGFSSFAGKLWSFELFAAEDTITVDGQPVTGRRSVTVGKIVLALLILSVGYWFSVIISRLLERVAVKRFKVEPNQANLVRRWIRVVLVLALVVFSMVSVKIPLTVFAFLGGALAIGLGFGTQNLLKNFISGIIILFERPFRVGDVLDINGKRGAVIGIGIRSSVLKLFDGTETLIPNSALLENNLTNWTYSDRMVRFTVTVGVAYGSDTRRVAQMLAEAAARHGLVEKEPVPQVFFLEFGDNSLNFELRFWVDVLRHNAAQIASDLRHMIAGAFAESGIVMAFPQRDVHLDASQPLRVQVVPEKEPLPQA